MQEKTPPASKCPLRQRRAPPWRAQRKAAGILRSETTRRADGRSLTYYSVSADDAPEAAAGAAGGPAFLVTGGAGYVAGPLVARLVKAGHQVVILDDLTTSSGRTVPAGVPVYQASVGDLVALREISARWQIAAVFHFAAASQVGESMERPLHYYRRNVREPLALIEHLVATGCPPLIFSSTAAVYGIPAESPVAEGTPVAPINPYGETKAAFERLLGWAGAAHGLPWAALRYFNAAGAEGPWEAKHPETHLIPNVLAAAADGPELRIFGTDYPTPDGTAIRDYIHIADLAEGHLAALGHLQRGGESGAFNLGSGTGHSVAEVVAAVERVTGRPVRRSAAPRRAGDPPALVADPSRARRVLGWSAQRTDLEGIVADAWRAMAPGAGAAAL